MALVKGKVEDGHRDLRAIYAGDELTQDNLLQFQFPAAYNFKDVVGIPEEDQAHSRGLDVLVILIRRIVRQLPLAYRDMEDETIRRQEKTNPLLRLAMADFSSTDPQLVQLARFEALKAFYEGPLREKDLSFAALVEHQLMRKTFWQRPGLLLLKQEVLVREKGVWKKGSLDIQDIVENSLVDFTTGNLGEVISNRFGTFGDADDNVLVKQCGFPGIIRIRYNVNASDPKRYQDLRKIKVDMRRPEKKASGMWGLTEPSAALTTFRLIAEVRLSSYRGHDSIRTYTAEGQVIPIPSSLPNTHRRTPLGDDDCYMLYYAQGVDDIPGEDMYSETPSNFSTLKASILHDAAHANFGEPPHQQASKHEANR
ncbi:uncharacterized protein F4812DRAFT_469727 [Daldinia caldariorum]|uniref:uncharacterized protein n=1 Tax=Daldinia caldariorum TaxID=326644 RepID=UPI002008904D|nr:uncharacterized protein F4812DRAFT_469727 [Daldinia caldariorum]KAI1469601.1 hypothetical protein F4812DRAFT_469727 [Daldinia caldariorum]